MKLTIAKYQFSYFLALLFLLIFSCKKDNTAIADDICNSWEVVDFMSLESMHYTKNDNYKPVIEFQTDNKFILKLDANSCFGSFSLEGKDGIEIKAPGCTYICCDSDFSNKFVLMLPKVESYSIDEKKMKLNIPGWGWINLNLN